MSKVLRSRHAEDVGGVIVEPGQPIPDDADPDTVDRLEAAGLIVDKGGGKSKSSGKGSSKSEG